MPDWPQTCCVAEDCFVLLILLPLVPECRIVGIYAYGQFYVLLEIGPRPLHVK